MFAYTFGICATLLFGLGMCLCMGVIGGNTVGFMVLGIILGIVGIAGIGVNYLLYKRLLENSMLGTFGDPTSTASLAMKVATGAGACILLLLLARSFIANPSATSNSHRNRKQPNRSRQTRR